MLRTITCGLTLILKSQPYIAFCRATRTVMSAARSNRRQVTAPPCPEHEDMTRRNVASSDENDEDELILCEVDFVPLTLIGLYSYFDDNFYISLLGNNIS